MLLQLEPLSMVCLFQIYFQVSLNMHIEKLFNHVHIYVLLNWQLALMHQ